MWASSFLLDPLLHVLGQKEKYPSGADSYLAQITGFGGVTTVAEGILILTVSFPSPVKLWLVFLHFKFVAKKKKFVAEYSYINTDTKN